MVNRLFAYTCGILLIMMQLSHALTLQEIEEEANFNYEDALDHLPEKQKNILIREHKAWLQYRDLRCEIHESIYGGNVEQCKILITYRHNIFLKILRPNQIDFIRFFNDKITQAIVDFQKYNLQDVDQSVDVNIAQKLSSQYQQFYSELDKDDQALFQKSYDAWIAHRNQVCLLLNSRNIIAYNDCAAKLSLDIISDMQYYLKD